jgi:hypothetical protein
MVPTTASNTDLIPPSRDGVREGGFEVGRQLVQELIK